MTFNADSADIEAAVNLCMISPIPLAPKKNIADFFPASVMSPGLQISGTSPSSSLKSPFSKWVTPSYEPQRQSLSGAASKAMLSAAERSDMSRVVYHIVQTNLPQSIYDSTSLSELILISRAIEMKLYQSASSYDAYLNPSTLQLRISALACAVLIHSEEEKGSKLERSETCSRLLAAARTSLPHCVMVLVSYETRQLQKMFGSSSVNEGY